MPNPLVTAIMITGKAHERWPLARAAVKAFQLQTYEPRELLIVSDSTISLVAELPPDPMVREIQVSKRTLGELRNVGLDEMRGDWACQWDDDDWHHPDRITVQMAAASSNAAVTLAHQVRYSFRNRNAFVHRGQRQKDGRDHGIVGTVLHPRTAFRYRAERKHEDSHFLQQWNQVTVVDNLVRPELYLRFQHGTNTWGATHIMQKFSGSTKPWRLPDQAARYLRTVLAEHYPQ